MLARDVTRLTTDVTEDVREEDRDSCDCRKAYISRCPKLAISILGWQCADVCVCVCVVCDYMCTVDCSQVTAKTASNTASTVDPGPMQRTAVQLSDSVTLTPANRVSRRVRVGRHWDATA